VISVSYDADQGSSVVSQTENESAGMVDDVRPRAPEYGSGVRRRDQDSVEGAEADAGAAA
jgi:hypothetical protein